MMKKTVSYFGNDAKRATGLFLKGELDLKNHEASYVSRRLPFDEDKKIGQVAYTWASKIGDRDQMAELVEKKGTAAQRADFGLRFEPYREKMKKTVETAKDAYHWGRRFPEDEEEMKPLIGGGEWAFRWAKDIGDENQMEKKIKLGFWQKKFEQEIKNEITTFT